MTAGRRSGLLPALWIGVVAGALEVGVRAGRHFGLGKLLFLGVDAWWGTPLLVALMVAVPTVIVSGLLSRTRIGPRLRYALPVGLASLELFLLFPQLASWAAGLLAAGMAVQGGRLLDRRSEAFERLARRTLPILLLVPALAGVALHLDRGRVHRPSAAAATSAPNVLLLVLDTVRALELGLYGFKPTISPNLDALGAQGVIFDQAFSSAPWTAPSHASLFTGRRMHELSIDWKLRLDNTYPTIAEALGAAGYSTVGIVANTEYTSAETGLGRGFADYRDYSLTPAEVLRWSGLSLGASRLWQTLRRPAPHDLTGRIGAEEINRRFIGWLDQRPRRPYFAFLNYFDAHAPYFPPEPFWSRFLPGESRRPHVVTPGAWSIERVRLGRRAYDGAIAYLDQQIGALLDSLRVRGALKETLVVVVGDHGEEFLEHGLMSHGNSLYSPSVHVPLLMVWAGHLAAQRVLQPVSLSQVPATVMNLLSLRHRFPGPGLEEAWTGGPASPIAVTSGVSFAGDLPAPYPVSHGSISSARLGRYRYIWSRTDSVGQLFDHETDPLESRNLVGEPWAAAVLRTLRDTAVAVLPGSKPRIR